MRVSHMQWPIFALTLAATACGPEVKLVDDMALDFAGGDSGHALRSPYLLGAIPLS
jgi:hypothetical protein